MSVYHTCNAIEARRLSDPLEPELQAVVSLLVTELNAGRLEEQPVLLITELSPQPLALKLNSVFLFPETVISKDFHSYSKQNSIPVLPLCQWWNIREKEKNLEEKESTLISGISFFGHAGKVVTWSLVQHVRCFCVTTGAKMCPQHLEHTKKPVSFLWAYLWAHGLTASRYSL